MIGKSLTGEYLYEDDDQFDVVPSKALNFANVNIRVKNEKSINSKSGQMLHYCVRLPFKSKIEFFLKYLNYYLSYVLTITEFKAM